MLWRSQISQLPERAPSSQCLVRNPGFGPGAAEDLVGGLGWGLAGGVEPEPEPGCLVAEHGIELLDGPWAVGRLAPVSLPVGDGGGLRGEDDDEQGPAADHGGHLGEVNLLVPGRGLFDPLLGQPAWSFAASAEAGQDDDDLPDADELGER